jgi:alkylated DNA repair dioxygenase AlkB
MTLPALLHKPFCTSVTALHSIPGLVLRYDFLKNKQNEEIQKKAMELHQKIISQQNTPFIQLKKPFLSKNHNLKSNKSYYNIQFNDESNTKKSCQHFKAYNENGHTLTYFIGQKNIPNFIQEQLISRILDIPEVSNLKGAREGDWNFTFNTYASDQSAKVPGFGYHKDIAFNGTITLIYSIGQQSIFNIRHPQEPDRVTSLPLVNNSLVLLSDTARWDYEHCVVPVAVDKETPQLGHQIRRMSLVLGVHPQI